MDAANISFTFFPCAVGGKRTIRSVRKEGLLHEEFQSAAFARVGAGKSESERRYAKMIGRAVSHLRLWRSLVDSNIHIANIVDDREDLCEDFRPRRNDLLARLPLSLDFVCLNYRWHRGHLYKLRASKNTNNNKNNNHNNNHNNKDNNNNYHNNNNTASAKASQAEHGRFKGHVFKMAAGSPTRTPLHNYVITWRWAKRMLQIAAGWSDPNIAFEEYVFRTIYQSPQLRGFRGFGAENGTLSVSD
ncbi:unnamed protein product, partial [Polarella glacialis]